MGPQIAKLYYQHLYLWFGLPCQIITDRDLCFTSNFGKALAKELGVAWNFSTAYHPQTDGLLEQKNQWLEQFLQLVGANQANWPTMLTLVTLMHNNTRTSTTGYTPNCLITSLEPTATPDHGEGSGNPLAKECVNQLRQQRILAHKALNRTANHHSPSEKMFRLGQRVWLEAKNLALPYGSIKLAPRHHSPFQITQVISLVVKATAGHEEFRENC